MYVQLSWEGQFSCISLGYLTVLAVGRNGFSFGVVGAVVPAVLVSYYGVARIYALTRIVSTLRSFVRCLWVSPEWCWTRYTPSVVWYRQLVIRCRWGLCYHWGCYRSIVGSLELFYSRLFNSADRSRPVHRIMDSAGVYSISYGFVTF